MISGLKRVAKALGPAPGRRARPMPSGCSRGWRRSAPPGSASPPRPGGTSSATPAPPWLKAGIVERRIRRIDDLSPEWRALWEAVLASGDRTPPRCGLPLRPLPQLAGCGPDEVTLDHAHAFLQCPRGQRDRQGPPGGVPRRRGGLEPGRRADPRLALAAPRAALPAGRPSASAGRLPGRLHRRSRPAHRLARRAGCRWRTRPTGGRCARRPASSTAPSSCASPPNWSMPGCPWRS